MNALPRRAPLLPGASADLQCGLYPFYVLHLKSRLTAYLGTLGTMVLLVVLGHDVATVLAVVSAAGLLAAEISARLLQNPLTGSLPALLTAQQAR